jgi:hypothetical protein
MRGMHWAPSSSRTGLYDEDSRIALTKVPGGSVRDHAEEPDEVNTFSPSGVRYLKEVGLNRFAVRGKSSFKT